MAERERYVRLDRVDVDTETALATMVCGFFGPMSIHRRREPSPGTGITPASSQEFMDHLKTQGLLGTQPDRYIHQVRDLLARLCADGILVDMGAGGINPMLPKSYYCFHQVSRARVPGLLWLARTLGGVSCTGRCPRRWCTLSGRIMKEKAAGWCSTAITC